MAEHYLCAVFISLSMDGIGTSTTLQGLSDNAHFYPWQWGAHRTYGGKQQ